MKLTCHAPRRVHVPKINKEWPRSPMFVKIPRILGENISRIWGWLVISTLEAPRCRLHKRGNVLAVLRSELSQRYPLGALPTQYRYVMFVVKHNSFQLPNQAQETIVAPVHGPQTD